MPEKTAHAYEPRIPTGQDSITIEVDPVSGSSSQHDVLGFDLEVLESPDGLTPSLRLQYDPGGRDGELGVGWRLQLGSEIRNRGPLGGAPSFVAGEDTVELDGRRLIPATNGEYVSRYEDGWTYQALPTGKSWIGYRDGSQLTFGDATTSSCSGNGVVAVSSPTGCAVDKYLLTQQQDAFGNRIEYVYSPSEPDLPSSVTYNHSEGGSWFEIRFLYVGRSDPRTVCVPGQCRQHTQRLDEIRVLNIEGASSRITHRYHFDYIDSSTNGPSNGRLYLSAVTQAGVVDDGSGNWSGESRILRTMTYEDFTTSQATSDAWASSEHLEFFDEAGSSISAVPPVIEAELAVDDDSDFAYSGSMIEDINGDGLLDIVVLNYDYQSDGQTLSTVDNRVFLNEWDAVNNRPRFILSQEQSTYLTAKTGAVEASDLVYLDLNRDGYVDLLRHGHFIWFGGPGGFDDPVVTSRTESWNTNDQRSFADVNGDGAPDIIEQGQWYRNTGGRNGQEFFGASTSISDPVLSSSGPYVDGCMDPTSPTKLVYRHDVGDVTGHPTLTHAPDVGTHDWDDLEIDGAEWLWRHTMHADVNGDGLADRLINVRWPKVDGGFWVDDPNCGGVEAVYYGDGTGAFILAPGTLGGDSSWASQPDLNTGTYPPTLGSPGGTFQVSYDLPVGHFGLVDIDGDGRAEALNRCGATGFSSPLKAIQYVNGATGFDCNSTLVDVLPVERNGALPIGGALASMVDLDGDGLSDGFLSGDVVDHGDVFDSNGSGISNFQNSQSFRWFRNTRTAIQGLLSTITHEQGGQVQLQWGKSARWASEPPPVNLTILRSATGIAGTTSYTYGEAAFGDGEFLGWGRIATRSPTDTVVVETFGTSVALAGKPWTVEEYGSDGGLLSVSTQVYREVGPASTDGFDFDPPYANSPIRTCVFEVPEQSPPSSLNRISFVLACEEFTGEMSGLTVDQFTADPSALTLSGAGQPGDHGLQPQGTWQWHRAPVDIASTIGAYGRELTTVVDVAALTTSQRDALRTFSRYGRGVPPNQSGTPANGQNHYDWLGQEALTSLADLTSAQIAASSIAHDPMTFGLTASTSLQDLQAYRLTIQEADWMDARHLLEVRELGDVTTPFDNTTTAYRWHTSGAGIEWPVLDDVTVTDKDGVDWTRFEFSKSHYDRGQWTQVTERTTNHAPLVSGGSQDRRTYQRTLTSRGQVEQFIPPAGAATTMQYGHCGLQSSATGSASTAMSYDLQCRLVGMTEDSGTAITISYDGLRRQKNRESSAGALSGATVFDHGTWFFDRSASTLASPSEVQVEESGGGVYSLSKVYSDPWGRVLREELCEWDRPASCPPSLEPSECTFAPPLAAHFPCDASGDVHIVRTTAWNNHNQIASETEWHDPATSTPLVTAYTYDDFGRLVERVSPDGVIERTEWGLGWSSTERVGGLKTRESSNALGTRVEWWDATNLAWVEQSLEVRDYLGRTTKVTDVTGMVTESTYDGFGRLQKKQLTDSEVYDECANTSDEYDVITLYYYDLADRLVAERDPSGDQTEWDYDDLSRVTAIRRVDRDLGGTIVQVETVGTRTYVDLPYPNRSVTMADGMGNSVSMSLLAWGEPYEIIHSDGTRVDLTYDSRQRLVEAYESYDDEGTYRRVYYDVLDRVVGESETFGHLGTSAFTSFDYNARGQITRAVDPDGQVVHREYDPYGRLYRTRLGTQLASARTLDELQYDAMGRIETRIENGVVKNYAYDQYERPTKELVGYDASTGQSLLSTHYTYDQANRVQFVENGDGSKVELIWDAHSRVERTKKYNAAGGLLSQRELRYDILGNTVQEIDEIGLTTCASYDFMGRISTLAEPGTAPTVWSYDRGVRHPTVASIPHGLRTTISSPAGQTVTSYTDGRGRMYATERDQLLTVNHYDQWGRLAKVDQRAAGAPATVLRESVTDYVSFSSRVSQFSEWLEAGWGETCLSNPMACQSGLTSQTYTLGGRVATLTDGNGQATVYSYASDGTALLERVDLQDVTAFEYQYDPSYAIISSRFEGLNNELEVQYSWERNLRVVGTSRSMAGSPVEESLRSFDQLGRVVSETRMINGVISASTTSTFNEHGFLERRVFELPGSSWSAELDWVYYDNGLVRTVGYPSNTAAIYDYEPGSTRLSSLTVVSNGVFMQDALSIPAGGYDADNRLLNYTVATGRPSQTTVAQTYEPGTNRLSFRDISHSGVSRYTETPAYDGLGRLASISRQTVSGIQPTVDVDYEYDVHDFILRENHVSTTGDTNEFLYSYDRSGNRTDFTGTHNGTSSSTQIQYAGSDKASAVVVNGLTTSIAWDTLGRQATSSSGAQLIYNLHHELVETSGGGASLTSEIGPDGREWSRTDGSGTEYFIPGPEGLVYEHVRTDGSTESTILVSGVAVATVDGSGAITVVVGGLDGKTSTFDEQLKVSTDAFNAWGMPLDGSMPSPGSGIGFHSMQQTALGELSRAGVRTYDTTIGRFTTPDPLLFVGGTSDLYRYAHNSPIALHDRSGLRSAPNGFAMSVHDGPGMEACSGGVATLCGRRSRYKRRERRLHRKTERRLRKEAALNLLIGQIRVERLYRKIGRIDGKKARLRRKWGRLVGIRSMGGSSEHVTSNKGPRFDPYQNYRAVIEGDENPGSLFGVPLGHHGEEDRPRATIQRRDGMRKEHDPASNPDAETGFVTPSDAAKRRRNLKSMNYDNEDGRWHHPPVDDPAPELKNEVADSLPVTRFLNRLYELLTRRNFFTRENVSSLDASEGLRNTTLELAAGGLFSLGAPVGRAASKGAIGFAEGTAETALTGMRGGGGHAIRKLQGDLIPDTGSLASRVDAFKDIATPILENPSISAPWRVGVTQGQAFVGTVADGRQLAVVVASEGAHQGKVISSFFPDAQQLALMGSR